MKNSVAFWRSPTEAIVVIFLLLFLIGTVNVFSASFVMAEQLFDDSYFFLKKHLQSFVIGLIGMLILARLDYRRLKSPAFVFMITGIVLGMLVAVHLGGVDANGAKRWLQLGVKFQPSEFAKLVSVVMVAAYIGPRLDRSKPVSLLSWPVGMLLVMGGFVYKQPDMGTALVIVGIGIVLYILAGISRQELGALAVLGAAGVVELIFAASYRAERITAWLDPWSYQQTSGYQTIQGLLAIGSGGFFGTGLGMGYSKFNYLPEAHNDFAFAVLCQEMGFVGCVLVLFLLGWLAWYGIKIALSAADGFGVMLGTGLTLLVVGQAIGNIAMVSGVIPVAGVPLPFISFGGTSLIMNMMAVGILVNIGRTTSQTKVQDKSHLEEIRARRANRAGLKLAPKD